VRIDVKAKFVSFDLHGTLIHFRFDETVRKVLGDRLPGVDPESLSIELMAYNDRPEFGEVAAVIRDQLGKPGIEVTIRAGEYAALEPDLLSGNSSPNPQEYYVLTADLALGGN
jgi:hypothetical protein